MITIDDYMTCNDPLNYCMDNDISVGMMKSGDECYVLIYNDRNDTSLSFSTSVHKLRGLAYFLHQHLGE
jgi:hypothetical protein